MVQHRAAHFVTGKPWRRDQRDSITGILRTLNWPTLQKCHQQARLVLLFIIPNDFLTAPSSNLSTRSSVLRTASLTTLNSQLCHVISQEWKVSKPQDFRWSYTHYLSSHTAKLTDSEKYTRFQCLAGKV